MELLKQKAGPKNRMRLYHSISTNPHQFKERPDLPLDESVKQDPFLAENKRDSFKIKPHLAAMPQDYNLNPAPEKKPASPFGIKKGKKKYNPYGTYQPKYFEEGPKKPGYLKLVKSKNSRLYSAEPSKLAKKVKEQSNKLYEEKSDNNESSEKQQPASYQTSSVAYQSITVAAYPAQQESYDPQETQQSQPSYAFIPGGYLSEDDSYDPQPVTSAAESNVVSLAQRNQDTIDSTVKTEQEEQSASGLERHLEAA